MLYSRLANTAGTVAYLYGPKSWSLSRAPLPAIHALNQCTQPMHSTKVVRTDHCIVLEQALPHSCYQRASLVSEHACVHGKHRLSLSQREPDTWADRCLFPRRQPPCFDLTSAPLCYVRRGLLSHSRLQSLYRAKRACTTMVSQLYGERRNTLLHAFPLQAASLSPNEGYPHTACLAARQACREGIEATLRDHLGC